MKSIKKSFPFGQHTVTLETGEIALEGPARELASDPRVVESYLGLGGRVSV